MARQSKKSTAQAIKRTASPSKKPSLNRKKKTSLSTQKVIRKSSKPATLASLKRTRKTPDIIPIANRAGELQNRLGSAVNVEPATPIPAPFFQEVPGELPAGYGDHFIYLMVRDPYALYAYWEIQKHRETEALQQLGGNWQKVRSILRIYQLSLGPAGHVFFDIPLALGAENWFIEVEPNQSYAVEIGLLHEDGRFIALARSNQVMTPRVTMSEILDEEWRGIDFEKMYALSGGFEVGKSSAALKQLMEDRLRNAITSQGSGSSGFPKLSNRNFWFNLNCELLVYGATEPDAKVSINGKSLALRPDGTFTLRYALPDGQIKVEAEAIAADGLDQKRITPVVVRKTQFDHPSSRIKQRH